MKKILIKAGSLCLIVLSVFVASLIITGCSSFGGKLTQDKILHYKKSKQFNNQKNIFENRISDINKRWKKRVYSFAAFKQIFFDGENKRPLKKLPEEKPDIDAFLKNKFNPQVIWFGHSSLLLSLKGKIILVDPLFSASASPWSFLNKRFQPPVLKLYQLPPIDYLMISHDHFDHLDMETIKFYKDKNVKFLVPLGVSVHLNKWGVAQSKIIELDWWDKTALDDLEFIFTPAQHFSGRGFFDEGKTLWGSWVIRSDNYKIYFSGDSGYDIHFKQIAQKYGPFDVAFLECGQYNLNWREVHMLPEDTMRAFMDLNAKKLFPVHWGMLDMSIHAWNEPPQKIYELAQKNNIQIVIPYIGESVDLTGTYKTKIWWNR